MNELEIAPVNAIIPVKQNNLFSNKFILIIPLFFVLSNTFKKSSVNSNPLSDIFAKLPNMIGFENLGEKIDLLKKIGPFLPDATVGTVNTIIISLDRINKVKGLMDVVSTNKVRHSIVTVENLSNKERLNHILTTITEEMPEDKIKNIKPVLDMALNFDKYKGLIDMMSTLSSTPSKSENQSNQSNQSSQNNKNMQLENMIDAIKPMLGENADKGMDKVKEMIQMFEMLNVLKTPEKEKLDK